MPSEFLQKQQNVPMMFRRHGDVTPKTKGHALGGHVPAHVYTRQLDIPAVENVVPLVAFDPSKSKVPNFIALDKKVLRFEGYFLEAVHESNVENYRVRKCVVLYYLEDNTIQIIEPKDMDANYGKKQYPMKEFMEASLGKFARPPDHRRRFVQHDRHVLRWFALWDDTSKLYGTKHRYILHFFLADNTVEIRESYDRNSGCDPFPKLLNRSRLLKQPKFEGPFATALTHAAPPPEDDFFSWEHLAVGVTVTIYNRNILLLDADESTREWYLDHGIDVGTALVLPDTSEKPKPFVPPPYNGIGSEIDSLGSCYHLTPKPHRKSMEETDNKIILRFCAHMDTTKPEDVLRRFIVSFMICDLSIMVMEPPQRNSGIGGGKFMERGIHKEPRRGTPFAKSDFYVGARIEVVGQGFILDNLDEYSAKYMEANPKDFPHADRDRVLRKLKDTWRPTLWHEVDGDAELTEAQARRWLGDLDLVHHEVIALLRGPCASEDGKLDVAKLKAELAK
ncbi:hypothetical protein DYB28_006548 [Aphanomyces astaci]|uniref:DM10 domain-containing protein n=1 Tax=Aphanomyces astaci TaxID=112090 RepID=A0A9X8DVD9_APHAT|nr:hypothetical protein DYB28_006548 [Aphanomyces astaci]